MLNKDVRYRQRDNENMNYQFTLILLATLCCLSAEQVPAQTQTQKKSESSVVPWEDRSWDERNLKGEYEDFHTFKHKKSFFFDPYIWAYSQEFAEKFRMPKEWIDPELKGAIAVAWRMTTIGTTTCGLGGRADSCWPKLTCQMDMYFDSQTPLPWRYNDVRQANFMRGISSGDSLPWLSKESPSLRYTEMGSKGPPLLKTAFRYVNSEFTTSGFLVTYFNRDYEPGVMQIGFADTCPDEGVDKPAVVRFFSEEEQKRTQGRIKNFAHTVEFSQSFMKKITNAYERQNKPNEDIIKRLMQDYFESRKNDPNFASRN